MSNSDRQLEFTARLNGVLWALIVVYAASRFLQVFPLVPMLAVVVLHVVPPALFALIHGARLYRLRSILFFMAICLTVGNIFENLGVRTGFPFGRYYFTDVMGPKVLVVPVFLGLAYVGMAYLSWTLARILLRETQAAVPVSHLLALPLLASCIMVSWDLAMEPVWSTIVRAWIWQDGGLYFGVPLSNFLGWFLTVYVFCQLFALYLRARPVSEPLQSKKPNPPGYWNLAVVFYAVSAAGNLLLLIPRPGPALVADPSGTLWKVTTINAGCAVVSIFTMGSFSLFAWLKRPRSPFDTKLGDVSASYATH
jgi:uncharacterized membrane protein